VYHYDPRAISLLPPGSISTEEARKSLLAACSEGSALRAISQKRVQKIGSPPALGSTFANLFLDRLAALGFLEL
jgi:hypothetical protein